MPFFSADFSAPFRLLFVCILIVLLAVPTAFVWIIVEMRSDYEEEVTREIASSWGGSETLVGPFIRIEVREEVSSTESEQLSDTRKRSFYFSPKTFAVESTTEHQFRHIGIFVRPVYVASMNVSGNFQNDLESIATRIGIESSQIESCSLWLTVSQSQAIRSLSGTFNSRTVEFEPSSTLAPYWTGDQIQTRLSMAECTAGTFDLDLELRGSHALNFTPVGDTSTINHSSSWPHPKFHGRQLPDSHEINEDGFSATWSSNALARGFASVLNKEEFEAMTDRSIGFTFNEPISLYRMVTRAVKYGFFVIGLTLLSIVCLEMIAKVNFHIVQYAILGGGLSLFYLLLLSLSEHIGFPWAFLLASASLSLLNIGYAWFSTKESKFCVSMSILFVGVYGALYVCLSSTDYALLIGSLLLVGLLVGLMYATRNLANLNEEQLD